MWTRLMRLELVSSNVNDIQRQIHASSAGLNTMVSSLARKQTLAHDTRVASPINAQRYLVAKHRSPLKQAKWPTTDL